MVENLFPGHRITESQAQRDKVCYVSASGGEIANEGEIRIVHKEKDGNEFGLTIQHAKVDCPILSVKWFTNLDCRVIFRKGGVLVFTRTDARIRFLRSSVSFSPA